MSIRTGTHSIVCLLFGWKTIGIRCQVNSQWIPGPFWPTATYWLMITLPTDCYLIYSQYYSCLLSSSPSRYTHTYLSTIHDTITIKKIIRLTHSYALFMRRNTHTYRIQSGREVRFIADWLWFHWHLRTSNKRTIVARRRWWPMA